MDDQLFDGKLFSNMFNLGIPFIEKIIRPIVVYFFLLIGLRLAGKRELAQINPMDLVVLMTLSNTVQNAIIGEDNTLLGGLIGATTLFLVNYFTVKFLANHPKISKVIEGDQDILIENGIIKMDRLKGEIINLADLEAAARKQGFSSLSLVETAILEPEGFLTFIAKDPSPDQERHQEVMSQLEALKKEIASLKS